MFNALFCLLVALSGKIHVFIMFPRVDLKFKSNLYKKKTPEVTKCTLRIVLYDECAPLEDAAEHNFGIFFVFVL